VHEPPALGGFGVQSPGSMFNEDSLRFFRMVRLLQDAELLPDVRTPRRTIWEIGGGWGGLAYYFKKVAPQATYLITSTPLLLLLSATYLMTLFPAANFRFYDPAAPDEFWRSWDEVDFAFAPESAVPDLRPPSLALTVDFGMFERMHTSRVAQHVAKAHQLCSRYLLSLCAFEDEAAAARVTTAIDSHYWLHPVALPDYLGRYLGVDRGETYVLGWRRLRR
jgi:putative sugar O-methyltransferase